MNTYFFHLNTLQFVVFSIPPNLVSKYNAATYNYLRSAATWLVKLVFTEPPVS